MSRAAASFAANPAMTPTSEPCTWWAWGEELHGRLRNGCGNGLEKGSGAAAAPRSPSLGYARSSRSPRAARAAAHRM
jgi:hypothetical protein